MSDDKRRKILIVTDSFRIQTGFSRVGSYIADALIDSGRWEVIYLGWFDTKTKITKPGIKLYFTKKNQNGELDQGDKYSRYTFPKIIEKEMPEIVLSIGDLWMTEHIGAAYNRRMFYWCNYMPIDGEPVPQHTMHGKINLHWPTVFKAMDKLVAYGMWGMQKINEASEMEVCSDWIHHGVDTTKFRPLPDEHRKEIRKNFFGLPENVFLFGSVSRNQPRKAYDRLIKAFAQFIRTKEDPNRPAYLYIHAPIADVGWNLKDLCKYYHVESRVILNESLRVGVGVTDQQLNEIYNAFHVFTLPTRGEGFGLPILEAMSCAIPVVTSEYSAHPEWCKQGSLFIKTNSLVHEPRTNIQRCVVNIDSYVAQLSRLYKSPAVRKKLGLAGRKKALSMDWTLICNQWLDLLDNIQFDQSEIEKDSAIMQKDIDTAEAISLVEI